MSSVKLSDNSIYQCVWDGLKDAKIDILAPGLEGYEDSIKRWSEAAEKRAAAVVFPNSTNDVSKIVQLLRHNDIDFVVACGRHSTSGASSIEKGVVIDMRKMNNVNVNVDDKTLTIQGGCNWENVDVAAAKFGLATPGGTVNHTGVGGLILGGGFGWLSGRHGLAIDNLISTELVLADGTIVRASETEQKDLFWAIRGCGASFGICTEFILQAHDQTTPVWGGIMAFTIDKLEQIVKLGNKHHEISKQDECFLIGIGAFPPHFQPIVLVALFYNGTEEAAKQYFADIINLEPIMNETQTMPYEHVNGMLNSTMGFGGRKTQVGSAMNFPVDPSFVQEIADSYGQFMKKNGEEFGGSMIALILLPYNKINSVPLESMAYANRGEYHNVEVSLRWVHSEKDQEGRAWARSMGTMIRERGGSMSSQGVGAYPNINENISGAKKMFGINSERLKELKKVYDPTNIFRHWHDLLMIEKDQV